LENPGVVARDLVIGAPQRPCWVAIAVILPLVSLPIPTPADIDIAEVSSTHSAPPSIRDIIHQALRLGQGVPGQLAWMMRIIHRGGYESVGEGPRRSRLI